MVWEIVFMLLILKIPLVWVCVVSWWAIKSEPAPPEDEVGVVADTPPPGGSPGGTVTASAGRCAPTHRARRRLRVTSESGPWQRWSARMTSVDAPADSRHSSADVVAGFLAVASIVLSLFAMGLGLILEVDARPARTCFVAIILALVSARLSAPLPVARAQGRPLRDAGVGRRDDARRVDRQSTDLETRADRAARCRDRYNTSHEWS